MSGLLAVLAASCAAGAVVLWLPPSPRRRFGSISGRRSRPARRVGVGAASAAAGASALLVLGWPAGALVGAGGAVAVLLVGRRVQSGAHRLRQEQLARQAPELADLLGAMVASGATSTGALRAAALAIGEPARTTLAPVVAALDLGAAPADAWAPAAVGPLAPIAGCFSRSASTGAPMMSVLAGVAADLRRKHRLAVEVRARAAGVRAVAPLAACFLPAFLLVGVAPIVASLASGLLG